jgi:hypothetical protein
MMKGLKYVQEGWFNSTFNTITFNTTFNTKLSIEPIILFNYHNLAYSTTETAQLLLEKGPCARP